MRRIDLHCYPGTQTWIASQGPYVDALGAYWGREWAAKSEEQVVADCHRRGRAGRPGRLRHRVADRGAALRQRYVAGMRDRHPEQLHPGLGAPSTRFKGESAIDEAKKAVTVHRVLGFHFHPIMGHFAVNDTALNPLFETIAGLGVPVMIDVGHHRHGRRHARRDGRADRARPAAPRSTTWPPISPR